MLPLEGEIDFGPLLPEHPSELIVGLILFVIIWWAIAKMVVPAFEKTYADRTAQIAGGIEKAESAQNEAAAALAQYQEMLANAREEAGRIREDARAQATAMASQIREQALADSARILASTKAQLEAERVQVVQQLRTEVGGLATQLAGRIVGEALDEDERAQRTVERFIAELEAQPVAEHR